MDNRFKHIADNYTDKTAYQPYVIKDWRKQPPSNKKGHYFLRVRLNRSLFDQITQFTIKYPKYTKSDLIKACLNLWLRWAETNDYDLNKMGFIDFPKLEKWKTDKHIDVLDIGGSVVLDRIHKALYHLVCPSRSIHDVTTFAIILFLKKLDAFETQNEQTTTEDSQL